MNNKKNTKKKKIKVIEKKCWMALETHQKQKAEPSPMVLLKAHLWWDLLNVIAGKPCPEGCWVGAGRRGEVVVAAGFAKW